jgi:hypothetical protein
VTVSTLDHTLQSTKMAGSAPYDTGFRRKILALFMVVLLIPIQPEAGGQRLDPYRIVLILLFLPFLVSLFKGRAGRFTFADTLILLFGFWMILTMVYHHGVGRMAYASVLAIELVGGYVLGRILIRTTSDYRSFIRYFLVALAVLLPFAMIELLTGRMLITEVLGKFVKATQKFNEMRNGLSRSQVVFPHSILFGLFCSLGVANVYYLYRDRLMSMLPRLALVIAMTLMAVSSAPMLSVGMQVMMIIWDKLTKARWMLLLIITSTMYISLEFLSNRGPVILLIETLTLDPSTAWWRVHIWNYGTVSVMANPIFGLGLNDWVRPYWLASTVDNFWLLMAMRHGLPGVIFLMGGIGAHIFYVLRAKNLTQDQRDVRTGYMVSMVGLLFTLSTVHVWDAMAVLVMFYIGAGSCLYSGISEAGPDENVEPLPAENVQRQVIAFRRSPPKKESIDGLGVLEQHAPRPKVTYRRVLSSTPTTQEQKNTT